MKKYILTILVVWYWVVGFSQKLEINTTWYYPSSYSGFVVDSVNEVVYFSNVDKVYRYTPNALLMDTALNIVEGIHYPNHEVETTISDGNGGYFIGGQFTQVGDSVRHGIAHVDSNGHVTSHFNDVGFNNSVKHLELWNDTLYVGGDFTSTGNISSYVGLMEKATGTLTNSFPEVDGEVKGSTSDGNGGMYLWGDFQRVNGILRNGVAHISSTGLLMDWNPYISGVIKVMTSTPDFLYVAGTINSVDNLITNNVVRFRIGADTLAPWTIPNFNNEINAIYVDSGRIYIGGDFTNVNSDGDDYLACIDTNGVLTDWTPSASHPVNVITGTGTHIYVGGEFNAINNIWRSRVCELDKDSGIVSSLNPGVMGSVFALASDGQRLFIGGQFNFAGNNNTTRNMLACYDLINDTLSPWNPNANWPVRALSIQDSSVIIGGDFTTIGNSNRKYLIKVDTVSGNEINWNMVSSHPVNSIHDYSTHLLISGTGSIGDKSQMGLAAYNVSQKNWINIYPNVDGQVNDIKVHGNDVIITGKFTEVGDSTRNAVCKLNKTLGHVLSWNSNSFGTGMCLTIDSNNLYIGGSFFTIGGQPRSGVGCVDVNTGIATSWSPVTNSQSIVETMELIGNELFVGGLFTYMGGVHVDNLVPLDITTGTGRAWSSNTINYRVKKIKREGQKLYVASLGVERFNLSSGSKDTFQKAGQTFAIQGDKIYIGGAFISGSILDPSSKIVGIDMNTGQPINWSANINPNIIIRRMIISHDTMFVVGNFTQLGTITTQNVGAISLATGNPLNWSTSINYYITDIQDFGDKLIITADDDTYNQLRAINKSNGVVSSWHPFNNTPWDDIIAKPFNNQLYVAGGFPSISGVNRTGLALFNDTLGSPLAYNPPQTIGQIRKMMPTNNGLYILSNSDIELLDIPSGNSLYLEQNLFLRNPCSINRYALFSVGSQLRSREVRYDSNDVWKVYNTPEINSIIDVKTFGNKVLVWGAIHANAALGSHIQKTILYNLTEIPNSSTDTRTECSPFTWVDGITYTQSDSTSSFIFTNQSGGDSTVYLNLTIDSSICQYSVDSVTSCNNEYLWMDGKIYSDSLLTGFHRLIASNGQDSIVKLELFIDSSQFVYSADSVSSCASEIVWLDGQIHSLWNPYGTKKFVTVGGCDSIVSLYFEVDSSQFIYSIDSVTTCNSQYQWIDGQTYSSSKLTGRIVFSNLGQCDSIVDLVLTIDSNSFIFNTDTIVACDSLTWLDGNTYVTNNNSAQVVLTGSNGCDSVVTLDLEILQPINVIDTIHACTYYTWIDGNTYLANNNTATYVLTGSNGCDSIVRLDLTISNPSYFIDSYWVCDSLLWIDGNTYYSDNSTATYTIIGGNSHGCDSVVTLNLTVNGSQSTDVVTACDSLTWINGITYYSNNNTAKDTLVNAVGCDSIVTLNLIIINSTSGVDVITACDSLTWINGITYFSSNNTAKDTLVNSVGCDSIVSLDLTILQSSTSVQNLADCDSLTWVNGVTYYQDTIDTYTIINSVGCDSVITLNLNLQHSTSAIDSIIAVNQYTWIDGVTYYAHNSTATHTLTNASGCDSVVSLYLEIQVVQIGLDQVGSTLIATADSGTFQWVECPSYDIITGATDSIFTPTQNGSYAVIVTQNGYTDTSDCITVNNVGIGEVSLSNNINIYPNPVHDQVNIEITNWPTNGVVIAVRDITGKQVYTQEVEPISNKETIQINTTKWAKGTYFIEVSDELNKVVEKIVVQSN